MIKAAVQKEVAKARAAGDGRAVQPGRLAGPRDRHGGAAARRSQVTRTTQRGPEFEEGRKPWPPPSRRSPFRCRNLPPLAGVRLNATAAGIRYQGRTDLVMIEVAPGSTVAGVFTSNKCPGAPVDWCREALKGGKARLVVVNAGNANVFTGKAGRDACAATAAAAAKLVGCASRSRSSSPPPA